MVDGLVPSGPEPALSPGNPALSPGNIDARIDTRFPTTIPASMRPPADHSDHISHICLIGNSGTSADDSPGLIRHRDRPRTSPRSI